MRLIIQRVSEASVTIEGNEVSKIGRGLLILLGVAADDNDEDVLWLVKKVVNLRIFGDGKGLMNLSITDIVGSAIVVSQFTLLASTKKGNRPSFINAAKPNHATTLYQNFIARLEQESGLNIQTGKFGEDMKVALINDGPVTIFIDSKTRE